jgi:hypothetical protein
LVRIVDADAASAISWRGVDVVTGQMHGAMILILCGFSAALLTTLSSLQSV